MKLPFSVHWVRGGGGGHSRPFCDDVRGDGGLESKMILHGDFLNTGGDWSPENTVEL